MLTRNLVPAGALALSLTIAACTPAQLEKAEGYQDRIARLCRVATVLSVVAGPYAVFITGACATEAAVAKLALDPSSHEWLAEMIEKVKLYRAKAT